MARRSGPIKVVTPLVRTVKQPYTSWKDSAVPGWDKIPGVAQHASRVSVGNEPVADGSDPNKPMKSNHPKV